MSAGAQARPAGVGGAAGAASSADVTDPAGAHQVQALLVDIFALTGQKVEIGDPLVAAALLRRAGQDAARAIREAAQSVRQETERSAREQQLAAGEFQRALHWLGLWQTRIMLGAVLLLFGMLAGAMGAFIVVMH